MKTFKSTKVFILLIAMVLFSISCQKESVDDSTFVKVSDNDISIPNAGSTRSNTPEETAEQKINKFIGCFSDAADRTNSPSFEEEFGERNDIRVVYHSNSDWVYIVPLLKKGEVTNLFLSNNEYELFNLEEAPSLSSGEINGTDISAHIVNVFNIKTFIESGIDLPSINNILSSDYTIVQSGNTLILTEKAALASTAHVGTGSTSSSIHLNVMCESVMLMMVDDYAGLLGINGQNYGTEILDAISACHPSTGDCVCPIPTCIINSMLPNIVDETVQLQLKLKYLEYEFHEVDFSTVDINITSHADLVNELYEIEQYGVGLLAPNSWDKAVICPEVIEAAFVEFADTRYLELKKVQFTFLPFNPFDYVHFCIEELCIQVSFYPLGGGPEIDITIASEMVAEQLGDATGVVQNLVASGVITLGGQAQTEYLDLVLNYLSLQFASASITPLSCTGSVGTTPILLEGESVFGLFCVEFPDDCWFQ